MSQTPHTRILPSIAAGDVLNLENEVRKLEAGGADGIHFDVMDGHYVPLLTLGVPFIESLKKITKLHLDVHIMVTNPDDTFENYIAAGADTLTFHIECARHAHRMALKIREAGRRSGIALSPATHWRDIEFLLPALDQVTIMTVNPGFSRQAHISDMHGKIHELSQHIKTKGLHTEILVDGGVQAGNAARLRELGATAFVAGGAVMGQPDYRAAMDALRR